MPTSSRSSSPFRMILLPGPRHPSRTWRGSTIRSRAAARTRSGRHCRASRRNLLWRDGVGDVESPQRAIHEVVLDEVRAVAENDEAGRSEGLPRPRLGQGLGAERGEARFVRSQRLRRRAETVGVQVFDPRSEDESIGRPEAQAGERLDGERSHLRVRAREVVDHRRAGPDTVRLAVPSVITRNREMRLLRRATISHATS